MGSAFLGVWLLLSARPQSTSCNHGLEETLKLLSFPPLAIGRGAILPRASSHLMQKLKEPPPIHLSSLRAPVQAYVPAASPG